MPIFFIGNTNALSGVLKIPDIKSISGLKENVTHVFVSSDQGLFTLPLSNDRIFSSNNEVVACVITIIRFSLLGLRSRPISRFTEFLSTVRQQRRQFRSNIVTVDHRLFTTYVQHDIRRPQSQYSRRCCIFSKGAFSTVHNLVNVLISDSSLKVYALGSNRVWAMVFSSNRTSSA